jgi:phage/plasmid-like protein (TIGR03299 family)
MSKETQEWLNTMTLKGYAETDGHAWHDDPALRAELGVADNHYPGPIPVADVIRRLFNWEPLEGNLVTTAVTDAGTYTWTDETRKTIIRPAGALGADDTGGILGIGKLTYLPHSYSGWLLGGLSNLVGDTLGVGSAGLLEMGAKAWVQIRTPETMHTPQGFDFRPYLLAATSMDGSLATTLKPVAEAVVCDNTMSIALGEAGVQVRIKHTSGSALRITEARQVLGIMAQTADAFAAEIASWCDVKVTPYHLDQILGALAPLPADLTGVSARAITMATTKREVLTNLYRTDPRVAPWAGTGWGVIQAVNTYEHWEKNVRGDRGERNMLRTIEGDFDKVDASTVAVLNRVLQLV